MHIPTICFEIFRNKLPLLSLNLKAAVNKKLTKDLADCKGVAFTADYWTSRAADPYIGMTLHYINTNFEMNKFMITFRSVEGRHTAANIAGHIDKVVSGIPALKSSTLRQCVTDNASAMLAAVPKLTKKIDVVMGCIDHLLNLIVKATNKSSPEIESAIKECRDLSGRVHHSPLDQQRIKRECWNLGNDSNSIECKFRKIISPVDTRWNSTMLMLKSIYLLRPVLESLQEGRYKETEKTDVKFKNLIPSSTSFQIMEQIIPILEKALLMLEVLSGDKKPTI